MIIEILAISTIVVLLVYFMITQIIAFEDRRLLYTRSFLYQRGYTSRISKHQLKAVNLEKGMSLTFQKVFDKNYEQRHYKFISRKRTDNQISFKLYKQGIKIDNYSQNTQPIWERLDLKLTTANQYHTQQILSQDNLIIKLERLLPVLYELEVKTREDGRTYVIIDMLEKPEVIKFCIRLIEELFNAIITNKNDYKGSTDFICFSCNSKISHEVQGCHFCGIFTPMCVICSNNHEPEEKVVIFQCCQSYVHDHHGKEWLKEKSLCPNCSFENPKYAYITS